MANDPELRSKFAKNAAEFTSTHGFDGMDVDWEYPGQRDTPNKDEDKQAFSLLLAEMRQEFDKGRLLLTSAVAAVKSSASLSYDIPVLSRLFSFFFYWFDCRKREFRARLNYACEENSVFFSFSFYMDKWKEWMMRLNWFECICIYIYFFFLIIRIRYIAILEMELQI